MTEQPATRDKVNPWSKDTWPEKNSGECHILKIKRDVPADTERTGKASHIKAWFKLDTGRSKGAEFDTIIPEQDVQQALKFWVNVETMEVGQEYEFDYNEQPRSMVVYRNSRWVLSDIQTDFVRRAKVIQDMMVEAGLGAIYNTADNREKIRDFDTTAQAVEWANKFIQEHSKPMTDKTEAPDKTIDDFIPRCKAHNMPVVDELTGRCEQCEIEASQPKHWSQSKDTFKKVAKCFQKRKESATVPDYMAAVKEWFEVNSMTEIDMTEEAFYAMLDDELEVRFRGGKKQETQNKPQEAPISKPSPTTPVETNSGQIERSSATGQTIEQEIREAEFVEETPKSLVIRQPETSFTGRALFPTQGEQQVMNTLADDAFKSGLLPKQIKSVFAAKFIVETGRELGIPASLALRKLHLINGNLGMAAELMWAMVLNSGKVEDFEITEGESSCTVMVKRMGMRPYTTTFTLDMARKMMTTEYDAQGNKKTIPLADKSTWRQMPGVMCKWRALSVACRTVFPDVTLGLYSREELEDSIDFNVQPELATTA